LIGGGIALAALSIAAIAWTNIRRNRARERHGLKTGTRRSYSDCGPVVVIFAFIILMNQAGGVPIGDILLAVAWPAPFACQRLRPLSLCDWR
jgi:ABC-type xylose transport system permease subunit